MAIQVVRTLFSRLLSSWQAAPGLVRLRHTDNFVMVWSLDYFSPIDGLSVPFLYNVYHGILHGKFPVQYTTYLLSLLYFSAFYISVCIFCEWFFFKFDFRRACVTYTISSMGISKVFLILISDFDFGPQQSQLEMSWLPVATNTTRKSHQMSPYKYPVVSHVQMLKHSLKQWSLAWQPSCL